MNNQLKKEVGNKLLLAMKNIDEAIFIMVQKLEMMDDPETGKLLNCKKDIKTILNQHFDELAIKRS